MSFSFLGGLASLLPNYIQGQRMANQDNWQDLMNYNNVQAGQMSNAFTEATWQPRLNMAWNSGMDSNYRTMNNAMQTATNYAAWPWALMNAQAQSMYAPWTAPMIPQMQMQQFWNTMQAQPGAQMGKQNNPWQNLWNNMQSPSGVRQ